MLLGRSVIRLEKYHYASLTGACSEQKSNDAFQSIEREKCLNNAETRTHPLWHLFYAVTED